MSAISAPRPAARQATSPLTWAKLLAFVKRGFLHASSYRLNFVGTYLGAILTVIFFSVLAKFFGDARPAALAPYGGDYYTFLLIGAAFARFLSLGLRHFGRELEHELAAGTIEPVMVTATPPALALLGPAVWILIEGIALVIIQLVLGAAFFSADFSQADWLAALVLAGLTLIALNSWGVVSAAFVLNVKRADPLSWLVDVTIFLLAGVYFPVQLLPGWLRFFAYLLPLTHALEGLRFALMGGQSVVELWRYVLILIGFNLILLPTSIVAFRLALQRVKRTGSLGHY